MAGALVGGAVLSAFPQLSFDRLASAAVADFFWGQNLTDEHSRKLQIALLSVNGVLEDVEEKQFTDATVRDWLDYLKHAVHDAEDLLDEIVTKGLQRKLESESESTTSQVKNSISASLFANKIKQKTKDVLDRLGFLEQKKNPLGLRGDVGERPLERLPRASLVEESDIFGRHDDKEAIIILLLLDDASGNEMVVLAIVGTGGIGKTTFAQLVYNDNRVKEHFNLQAWICVSEELDPFKVTKAIVEAITSSTCDAKDLNQLQITLKRKLVGRKFLLVLDDVCNKNCADWEVLGNPFKVGAPGSRMIVITRDDDVASVMRASATHCLEKLPVEYRWPLLESHAFYGGNSNAHPQLEELGRQIIEKCDGHPFAIKVIGALLRSRLDIDEWEKVLKSERWNPSIGETMILPALRLSYKYLPIHLKKCFAYCSIFPKYYTFEKDQVILLWMAEGFLPQSRSTTMEEVGEDYFLYLVSRSLFQQSSGDKSCFAMHNLVNDLAKFV